MNENMIRFLVQKYITCPVTGNILDMRTCAVILDRDGDPLAVYDPSVPAELEKMRGDKELSNGATWMDRS